MKTIKLIPTLFLILIVICLSGLSAYAVEPAVPPAQHLQKVIKDGIKYPEQAVKSCCTGSVEVLFSVDENGKIIIEETSADNAKIEKMVKEQLAAICCKGVKIATYEHYRITITFKLIG